MSVLNVADMYGFALKEEDTMDSLYRMHKLLRKL